MNLPYIRFTRAELMTDFGTITQYYPEAEVTPALTSRWMESANDWADEVQAAEVAGFAGDTEGAQYALERASRVERLWGDNPSTRRIEGLFLRTGFVLDFSL